MTLRLPDAEQQAMSDSLAGFFSAQFPRERLRSTQCADAASWRSIAGMGALGISLPTPDGGLGLSWTDGVLACREAGRHLVSPALVGSSIAAHVAARSGQRALCAALLGGEQRAGIAITASGSGFRVIDGETGLFLVLDPGGVRLLECDAGSLQPLACIDETVQLCATPVAAAELASVNDAGLAAAARLLVAALLCGLLEAARDMAAEHARARSQFGRPIGAFQAIKHRCADSALAAELCWSQTLYAANALDTGAADAQFHALAACLLAGEEALKAARFNIQAHGAMGFTDELDAHRLLKRAHVLQQLFGDPRAAPSQLLNLRLDLE